MTVAPTTGPRTAGAIARAHIASGRRPDRGGGRRRHHQRSGRRHGGIRTVPLAILPAGTANVLAMEMKLGGNLERVAAAWSELRPRRISVGHVTCDGGRVSRHFLLMAGIGLDAHIVYHVNAALKARTGKFAYWVAGWSLLGHRLPSSTWRLAARQQCSFALLSKVRNYGGDFEIARNVTLLRRPVRGGAVRGPHLTPYVKYLAGMALNRLEGMNGVTRTARGPR